MITKELLYSNFRIHICRESNLYRQKLLWTVHNYYKCMAFTFSNKDEPKVRNSFSVNIITRRVVGEVCRVKKFF